MSSQTQAIKQVPVTIVKTADGTFDADGFSGFIPCNARNLGPANLVTKLTAWGCNQIVPLGEQAPDGFPNIIATVKMDTAQGYIYILATDFDGFETKCSECCNP